MRGPLPAMATGSEAAHTGHGGRRRAPEGRPRIADAPSRVRRLLPSVGHCHLDEEAARAAVARLLVIEDGADVCMTLATPCEQWGHEVEAATSGREALASVAVTRGQPRESPVLRGLTTLPLAGRDAPRVCSETRG
jgi:hypothetical protein